MFTDILYGWHTILKVSVILVYSNTDRKKRRVLVIGFWSKLSPLPSMCSTDPSWWTSECSASVNGQNRAWKHWQRNKHDEGLKTTFISPVTRSVLVLSKAKAATESRLRAKLTSGSLRDKEWWCTIKRAAGSSRAGSVPISVDSNEREHHTSSEKANRLAGLLLEQSEISALMTCRTPIFHIFIP